MRLTLLEVLLLEALASGGAAVGYVMARLLHLHHGKALALLAACAIASVLAFAPPIYRRLRWLPLWLPRCRHCRRRPASYEIAGHWPTFMCVCPLCHGRAEVWMRRGVTPADASAGVPSVCLRWPEFIGWWRPI